MVKLSDLECPLPSLAPLAELLTCGCGGGLPLASGWLSCGVALLPIGVAKRSCGGAGREEGRCICASGGRLGTELLVTGFWEGDGGIASPSRGVRGPPLLRPRPPGTGGLRRGAGEDVGGGWIAFSCLLLSWGSPILNKMDRGSKVGVALSPRPIPAFVTSEMGRRL